MAFHWKPFLNEYSIVKTDTPTFTESKGSKTKVNSILL